MNRFYLHLYNSTGLTRDNEGVEAADLGQAREQAIAGIRSILSDEIKHGLIDLRGRIEIAAESSEVLDVVLFEASVEILHGASTA